MTLTATYSRRPEAWIDLHAGTFTGTDVRAAILVIEAGLPDTTERDDHATHG